MKKLIVLTIAMLLLSFIGCENDDANHEQAEDNTFDGGYYLVDTGQSKFYNNTGEISEPSASDAFYGQDAYHERNAPKYINNGNNTITDLVTGLMWSQSADIDGDGDIDASDKLTFAEAAESANDFVLGGFDDWRLPTIKELYSLIIFSGVDPSGYSGTLTNDLVPFIATEYFDFEYGDTDASERIIDAQYVSSTVYVAETEFASGELVFGVNFADGRIKGYPTTNKTFYVAYVRGNSDYGINQFVDNGNSTITDNATGLMWTQDDNGEGVNWEEALHYAENLNLAGYSDWRLPNSKELQSIIDYTRSPGTTNSAAIDPFLKATTISNEENENDFPFYWSSTTHANWTNQSGANAAYLSFGRALGYFNNTWMDVHGAGAQRSDPKTGDPGDYPIGHGPQGDAIRIFNYVRCVRDI